MGCRASPGQNKMALNVLKTHVRSETRVTGILNITVDSHWSSTCNGAHMCAFFLAGVNGGTTWMREAQGWLTLAEQSSASFIAVEFSDYQSQVLASVLALNSHTEDVNSSTPIHNHHLVTQPMLFRFWFGNFIPYGEIIRFHMGILLPLHPSSLPLVARYKPISDSCGGHPTVSGRVLRYAHLECPLIQDTRGSLLWGSQIHSYAWAWPHLSPVLLGH